jgi:phage-related protein
MPRTEILFYREDDGSVPVRDWLLGLPAEPQDRCVVRLGLLAQRGHELRRPHCENLGDGIYELRVKHGRVNYRMLYFFHGQVAAVVSHGFTKEAQVPPKEIAKAIERAAKFQQDPKRHTFQPGQ